MSVEPKTLTFYRASCQKLLPHSCNMGLFLFVNPLILVGAYCLCSGFRAIYGSRYINHNGGGGGGFVLAAWAQHFERAKFCTIFRCTCPPAYSGFNCELNTLTFEGDGYSWFESIPLCAQTQISLQFSTMEEDGLLFYNGPITDDASKPDFIGMYFEVMNLVQLC